MVNIVSNITNTCLPEKPSVTRKNNISTVCIPTNTNFFSDGAFPYTSIVKPVGWIPPSGIDSHCPTSMLRAIPMKSEGAKQTFKVWVSLFFAFSRSGVTFISFWQKQERDRPDYWEER